MLRCPYPGYKVSIIQYSIHFIQFRVKSNKNRDIRYIVLVACNLKQHLLLDFCCCESREISEPSRTNIRLFPNHKSTTRRKINQACICLFLS